jgi:hypothetical protein
MGQIDSLKIQGNILYPSQRYAYLLLPDEDSLIGAAINDGKFLFSVKKRRDFTTAYLFLNATALEALNSNRKDSILKSTNKRLIALESVKISIRNDINDAIITGGIYNNQINEMMNAIKEGKYAFFLSTYPDSPVSILFLSSILVLKQNRIMGVEVNLIALADLLSEGLKHSEKGKVLMDKIRLHK